MTEIAKPITGLFLTGSIPSAAQIDEYFEVVFRENLRRTPLIHSFWLPVYDEFELFGTVGRNKADGRSGWDDSV